MGVLSNKIERDQLKPGDHIYSWRHAYIYAHHGIYIGDGNVIHFTQGAGQEIGTGTVLDRYIFSSSPSVNSLGIPCQRCGDQSKYHGVIKSCLDCFLSGGELYRFEYNVSKAFFLAKVRSGTCTLAPSDPPLDVLHRAKYLLEKKGFGVYDLFKNNCEDFAMYCKTSLLVGGQSGQAASFLNATKVVVSYLLGFLTASPPCMVAVSCGLHCASWWGSDIGVCRDVIKVQVEQLDALLGSVSQGQTSTETPKND